MSKLDGYEIGTEKGNQGARFEAVALWFSGEIIGRKTWVIEEITR